MPCEGFTDADFEGLVSKLLEESEAKKELAEGQNLAAIDTLVSPINTKGTLQARYQHGVYALRACPASTASEEVSAWQEAVKERKQDANNADTQCDLSNRTTLVFMEAARGDLKWIENAEPSWVSKRAGKWLHALGNALQGLLNMHQHHYFHFDVKPANMLWFGSFDDPQTVKLTDFGMAVHAQNQRREFLNSTALIFPWYNWGPAIVVAVSMHADVNAAPPMNSAKLNEKEAAEAAKAAQDAKRAMILDSWNQAVLYWQPFAQARPVSQSAPRAPPAAAALSAVLKPVAKSADGKRTLVPGGGAFYVPKWADQSAFSRAGIRANALRAAQKYTLEELASAADLFGFALTLVPFHEAFTVINETHAAQLIKEFFDAAAKLDLSDADARTRFQAIERAAVQAQAKAVVH